MAALDFPNSPTTNQQYAAPNGVTYQWDGAAWVVTGGPPGQLWTGTATALTPTDATKQVAIPGTASVAPALVMGTQTAKGRVEGATTLARVGLFLNRDIGTNTQDDATKPSWSLYLQDDTDLAIIQRSPAGSVTQTNLLQVEGGGAVAIPGSTSSGEALRLGNLTPKSRLFPNPASDRTLLSHNVALNAGATAFVKDDGTKAAWLLHLQCDNDQTLLQRFASGSNTPVNMLQVDNAGSLTIAGPNAVKGGSTTAWTLSSDARIKRNVHPYTRGLVAILALEPKTFEFNGKGGSQDGLAGIGLVADDVLEVMPEMVGTRKGKIDPEDAEDTDIRTLDTSALQLALVNAVKELAARLAALETHAP